MAVDRVYLGGLGSGKSLEGHIGMIRGVGKLERQLQKLVDGCIQRAGAGNDTTVNLHVGRSPVVTAWRVRAMLEDSYAALPRPQRRRRRGRRVELVVQSLAGEHYRLRLRLDTAGVVLDAETAR